MAGESDDFRMLFDANPRPMFVSDQETLRILEVNRAAVELYGWSRDELLTMTLRDIRPPSEIASFEASFADPTKTASPKYARLGRHHTKTGKVLEVTLEISRTTYRGRPAALALITDVTGIGEAERRF